MKAISFVGCTFDLEMRTAVFGFAAAAGGDDAFVVAAVGGVADDGTAVGRLLTFRSRPADFSFRQGGSL